MSAVPRSRLAGRDPALRGRGLAGWARALEAWAGALAPCTGALAACTCALAACTCALALGACGDRPSDRAPIVAAQRAPAPLELPRIFGDGMVLQRGARTPVWGRADPGELVRVRLLDGGVPVAGEQRTLADGAGAWRLELADLVAGGPWRLEVHGGAGGGRVRAFEDVLVGEVWLGSGQSNMRMEVAACERAEEARGLADRATLRVFLEESLASQSPRWSGTGDWVRCTPATCGEFSGALFWFGVEVQDELGVPLGLIDTSVGGSRIELWTSAPQQFASPPIAAYATEREAEYWSFDHDGFLASFGPQLAEWQVLADAARLRGEPPPLRPRNRAEGRLRHGGPGFLFNAKIAPLAGYGLAGFLWYQGEDNVLHARHYGAQLELLVDDWRTRWGQGQLPFCWVQLPGYGDPRPDADWARVREEMRRALCIPGAGMVVAIDVGLSGDIHPTNKPAIGHRLAGWALSEVYARPRAWSSPLYAGHVVAGGRVTVCFDPSYGWLAPNDRELEHFELAGEDRRWHPARAWVDGPGDRYVTVESDAVPSPVDVRFAWTSDPRVGLFNAAGLPASPFTTRL